MSPQKRINRKTFFKWATAALAVPLAYVWQASVSRDKSFSKQEQSLKIEKNLPDGVHFFDRVILVKDNENYKLMSSKCTHLGCKIDKMDHDQMVCPCHGSRYNKNGRPVIGPAVDPLHEIPFTTEKTDDSLILRYKL